MATNIETLTVTLKAVTKGFNSGVGLAVKGIKEFGAAVGKIGFRALQAGFLAAAGGVAALAFQMKKAIDEGTKLNRIARRIGISAEKLSGFKFAAAFEGVQFRQFELAMQRLTRRIGEASAGIGEARSALKLLGLDAQKLAQLRPDQQFLAVADAFKDIENDSEKVFAAFRIFEAEGVDLVQLIGEGSDKLKELLRDAENLGVVLRPEQTIAFEKMTQEMLRLSSAFRGVANELVTQLAPAFLTILPALTGMLVEMRKGASQIQFMSSILVASFAIVENSILALKIAWVTTSKSITSGITALTGAIMGSFIAAAAQAAAALQGGAKHSARYRAEMEGLATAIDFANKGLASFLSEQADIETAMKRAAKGLEEELTNLVQERLEQMRQIMEDIKVEAEDLAKNLAVVGRTALAGPTELFVRGEVTGAVLGLKNVLVSLGEETDNVADKFIQLGQTILDSLANKAINAAIDALFQTPFISGFFSAAAPAAGSALGAASSQVLAGFSGTSALRGSGGLFGSAKGNVFTRPSVTTISERPGLNEAVLPLGRGAGGDLGVKATININVNGATDADSFRRSEPAIRRRMESFLMENRRGIS